MFSSAINASRTAPSYVLFLAVLLALHHTRIARGQTFGLQRRLPFWIDFDQRFRHRQTNGFSLTSDSASVHIDIDVVLTLCFSDCKRLVHFILKDASGEILRHWALVHCHCALAGLHVDAGNARLATA